MDAISLENRLAKIILERCVECGTCKRMLVCPTDAIKETRLVWPRSIRRFFSDPLSEHKETGIPGRGTEEMKTNDVTERFDYGEAGFSIELGRPSTGAALRDIEKVSTALAKLNVEFEPQNPLTYLMKNKETGELRDDIRNERVLSAIIEFKVPLELVEIVLGTLQKVTENIGTVFSVGVACRVSPDGSIPVATIIEKAGLRMYPNGKTNVGLGYKPSLQVR
jgi:ferredoxin